MEQIYWNRGFRARFHDSFTASSDGRNFHCELVRTGNLHDFDGHRIKKSGDFTEIRHSKIRPEYTYDVRQNAQLLRYVEKSGIGRTVRHLSPVHALKDAGQSGLLGEVLCRRGLIPDRFLDVATSAGIYAVLGASLGLVFAGAAAATPVAAAAASSHVVACVLGTSSFSSLYAGLTQWSDYAEARKKREFMIECGAFLEAYLEDKFTSPEALIQSLPKLRRQVTDNFYRQVYLVFCREMEVVGLKWLALRFGPSKGLFDALITVPATKEEARKTPDYDPRTQSWHFP